MKKLRSGGKFTGMMPPTISSRASARGRARKARFSAFLEKPAPLKSPLMINWDTAWNLAATATLTLLRSFTIGFGYLLVRDPASRLSDRVKANEMVGPVTMILLTALMVTFALAPGDTIARVLQTAPSSWIGGHINLLLDRTNERPWFAAVAVALVGLSHVLVAKIGVWRQKLPDEAVLWVAYAFAAMTIGALAVFTVGDSIAHVFFRLTGVPLFQWWVGGYGWAEVIVAVMPIVGYPAAAGISFYFVKWSMPHVSAPFRQIARVISILVFTPIVTLYAVYLGLQLSYLLYLFDTQAAALEAKVDGAAFVASAARCELLAGQPIVRCRVLTHNSANRSYVVTDNPKVYVEVPVDDSSVTFAVPVPTPAPVDLPISQLPSSAPVPSGTEVKSVFLDGGVLTPLMVGSGGGFSLTLNIPIDARFCAEVDAKKPVKQVVMHMTLQASRSRPSRKYAPLETFEAKFEVTPVQWRGSTSTGWQRLNIERLHAVCRNQNGLKEPPKR